MLNSSDVFVIQNTSIWFTLKYKMISIKRMFNNWQAHKHLVTDILVLIK